MRSRFSDENIAQADRMLQRLWRYHALNQQLVDLVDRLISEEKPITLKGVSRRLRVDGKQIDRLRKWHPAIFQIISRYEFGRRLFAEGRRLNGERPKVHRRPTLRIDSPPTVPLDPLLARLKEVHHQSA